jgi:hypothetical protein
MVPPDDSCREIVFPGVEASLSLDRAQSVIDRIVEELPTIRPLT